MFFQIPQGLINSKIILSGRPAHPRPTHRPRARPAGHPSPSQPSPANQPRRAQAQDGLPQAAPARAGPSSPARRPPQSETHQARQLAEATPPKPRTGLGHGPQATPARASPEAPPKPAEAKARPSRPPKVILLIFPGPDKFKNNTFRPPRPPEAPRPAPRLHLSPQKPQARPSRPPKVFFFEFPRA